MRNPQNRFALIGVRRAVVADVRDEEAVSDVVALSVCEFGGLDAIYANAGIDGGLVPFTEQTLDYWQQILRVNLIGSFLAIKHAAPIMVKQGGGSIICTASVAGIKANAGGAAYSASKAGIISLVQVCANELYGTGVRVNPNCPGLIESGMTKEFFAMGMAEKVGRLNPLKRAGAGAEVAQLALYLASDDASYVNGQAIAVDGGPSSLLPFAVEPLVGSSPHV